MGTTMRSPTNNSRKVLSLDRLNTFLLLLTIFSFYSAVWMFQLAHPSPSYNHQLALKHHLEDRPTLSTTASGGVDNNNKQHNVVNKETPDESTSIGIESKQQDGIDNNDNKEHDDIVDNETLDKLFIQDGTREVSDIISNTLDTLQKKHPSYKETPKEEQLALKDEVLKHLLKMKERRAKQLQLISPSNKPLNWQTYGFYKTRHYFQCKEHAHKLNKPLPTIDYWNELKDAYRKYIDDIEFDESVSPVDGYNFDGLGNPQPYRAASGSRGRGLFASRYIKRGELVHDGTKSDYLFTSKEQWLRLVYNLPRDMACDLIDWSWTAQTSKNGPFKLFSAINISILMNGSDLNEQNVNPPNEYTSKMYALRDIKKGEELLFDYDIYETAWDEVDLDDDNEDLYDDDDNEWAIDDKLQEEDKIEAVENRGEIMLEAVPVKLKRGRPKFQ